MGGRAMLKRLALTLVAAVQEATDRAAARGQAWFWHLTSTAAVAAFTVADAVRAESGFSRGNGPIAILAGAGTTCS
jgi:hypothetical protein